MTIAIALLGGLGLFLLGMKLMSDGLENAAGAKMKNILDFMTRNRFVGVVVGALFTAIIQSSSAATVMVVSFVNAGLMSLTQAAGVIMGANVGTTITAQLVAFNLAGVAPVFLFAGVCIRLFVKNKSLKRWGDIILGFGVLFMGINNMSTAMETLKDSAAVVAVFSKLSNPILAILVGTVITAMIQSSSVTVSILLLMVSQELIALPICFYVILGCNIGACTSALLASLSGKKDAKRAAMIHFLFNVIGSAVIAIFLIFGKNWFADAMLSISGGNLGRSVANAHTVFKIFQVVIMLPFAGGLVKLTNLIIPGEDAASQQTQLKYIGKHGIFSPTTAVMETVQEINAMGQLTLENLKTSMEGFMEQDSEKIAQVYEVEKRIDSLSHQISDYLVKLSQADIPLSDAARIGNLFHVVNDIERIGDHAENIADAACYFETEHLTFSKKARKEFIVMYEMVNEILTLSLEMFYTGSQENMDRIMELENEIDRMDRMLQSNHVHRLSKGKCDPMAGVSFTDLVSGFERIADHSTNIAFSILTYDSEEEYEI